MARHHLAWNREKNQQLCEGDGEGIEEGRHSGSGRVSLHFSGGDDTGEDDSDGPEEDKGPSWADIREIGLAIAGEKLSVRGGECGLIEDGPIRDRLTKTAGGDNWKLRTKSKTRNQKHKSWNQFLKILQEPVQLATLAAIICHCSLVMSQQSIGNYKQ
ncbi:hypothetical protein Cgig2_012323 [Carnegiea gigantea]|uniref:Uncharacterized protein n=1 Tax=Carnegiea gigantea TaxID=171969 RepID=A0A9Q1JT61_9CARY|nr:hypothetical protein Cgig2_012323 [Carnegiea gigantea]